MLFVALSISDFKPSSTLLLYLFLEVRYAPEGSNITIDADKFASCSTFKLTSKLILDRIYAREGAL